MVWAITAVEIVAGTLMALGWRTRWMASAPVHHRRRGHPADPSPFGWFVGDTARVAASTARLMVLLTGDRHGRQALRPRPTRSEQTMHLLLAEDDLELGAELPAWPCRAAGSRAEWVRGTRHTRAMTEGESATTTRRRIACVLLDSRLPDGDGIDLLVHWRRRSSLDACHHDVGPRRAVELRVAALDAGADDHRHQTCAPVEIASRIPRGGPPNVAGEPRRSGTWAPCGSPPPARAKVRVDGEILPLSPKEYRSSNWPAPGETVSKQHLARAVALSEPLEFSALGHSPQSAPQDRHPAHSHRAWRGYCPGE
ncbi:MAG: response regulator transcription factor [Piscinibacter sp.]|nr:response regulator transcription factor [Piscinibacter sp.]